MDTLNSKKILNLTPSSMPVHSPEDSDSASDRSTTRTISPQTEGMSAEPNVMVVGTLGQRQAAAINNLLPKIPVKKPIDSDTWNSWLDSIELGLSGAMYDNYIKTDELPIGEDGSLHRVIQKCLVTWMIANMSQMESDRALSYLTTYSKTGEKKIDYEPALLWTKMREYHASQSTHK
ncbi:hypothetical protein CROQUDRAFT_102274 [Cronartium quercuum f. sp. fusiforme G11]|uniref:Uncharacterized protein n=1 Tax=Cronartium quercuum f. sp. fusiforme G11 TaxID=708437 RepID=A0A9P6T531_9BASI|nr:hypothetical protein CROQUDRAFT_102274 [Cronartium quercuum f. sp. fusiforme G11]